MSPADPASHWRIWVDTGGTFTDCLAVPPHGGALRRAKVLSSGCLRGRIEGERGPRRLALSGMVGLVPGPLPGWVLRPVAGGEGIATRSWDEGGVVELDAQPGAGLEAGTLCELASPEEAPVLACRIVTGTPAAAPLPPIELRLATTLGTNALLERRGAPTALFLTRGFADLLEIGTQQRPDLFALEVRKPQPLHVLSLEVDERIDARGEELRPLDLDALREAARRAREAGAEAAAVALLHAYLSPEHERLAAEELRRAGFAQVSASAELAPAQGYLARAETALVDAYLAPILARYLARIGAALASTGNGPARRILVMTSAGGLVAADRFRPHEGLLSGPAAGVVGAAASARRSGVMRIVAFDMGGTSTDVARWEGELPWVHEHRVGDARLLAPAVAVETVAAGGGSICTFDGHALRVGPESAGSRPGPACYGAGGPLCLTDVNLLLGRVDPSRFEIPVEVEAAARACDRVRAALDAAGQGGAPREALLAGLLRIADERTAEAIREISVRQGYDPAEYTLLVFGGAGGQHACAVADLLGIRRVLLPPDGSLLSAFGLGSARVERVVSRQVLRPLAAVAGRLGEWLEEVAEEARVRVAAEGVAHGDVAVERRVADLRWVGQESTLEVPFAGGGGKDLLAGFSARYRERFGYLPWGREAELVSLRVAAAGPAPALPQVESPSPRGEPAPRVTRQAWFGEWRDVPVADRVSLGAETLRGPALVVEPHTVCVVDAGWEASLNDAGALVLYRVEGTGEPPLR